MERARPNIWSAQKTDDQGHVDLWDTSDEMMDQWFKQLAADGVTSLRLFASHVFKISANTSDDYVLVLTGSRVSLEL